VHAHTDLDAVQAHDIHICDVVGRWMWWDRAPDATPAAIVNDD
jgi:hypothetical protein